MWLIFAFSAPLFWAISTHIDKYLVERYFKNSSTAVLLVFTAVISLLFLPPIWSFNRVVFDIPAVNIAVSMLSGVLYMGGMYFYLQALQTEEASVIAPLFQISPLFGYGLSYLVLGERLTRMQMAGGLLVIIGAALLSLRRSDNPRAARVQVIGLMVACAFVLSLSTVIFKLFAIHDDYWTTTFWMFAGEALFGAALLLQGSARTQLREMLGTNAGAVLSVNAVNELVNVGGSLGARYALLLAPLSLVQTIGSTTSLFVFGIGVAMSLLMPKLVQEDLSTRNLLQKGVAALFIVVGVSILGQASF